ncbi:putative acyltransferase [Polaromonas sp. CG_23.6]|nr:putative acyltransferase [Polaromonas sp. CG_23.6]
MACLACATRVAFGYFIFAVGCAIFFFHSCRVSNHHCTFHCPLSAPGLP